MSGGIFMDEDRKERLEAAKIEQFAALGEFVQDFELVCFALKPLFVFCFHRYGLSPQGQPLANIAIDNHYLTADPLVSIVSAVYQMAVKDDEVALKVMRDLEKRFKALIEIRNRVIHGTWLIGWTGSEQQEFSEIIGIYNKITKNGLEARDMPKSASELKKLSEEAKDLEDIARRLMIPLLPTDEKMRGKNQFIFDRTKWKPRFGRRSTG
jgi:hypothetical protein